MTNESSHEARSSTEGRPPLVPGAAAQLETLRGGGSWFYWIAGLTLVNSVLAHSGSNRNFVLGLAIVGVIDFGVREGIPRGLALAVDILAIGGFALLGHRACRRSGPAFVTGIVIYSLDTALLLIAGLSADSLFSIGIHAFCLVSVVLGYRALLRLRALERDAVASQAGAYPPFPPGTELGVAQDTGIAVPVAYPVYPQPPAGTVLPTRAELLSPASDVAPRLEAPPAPAPLRPEALGLKAYGGWLLEPAFTKDLAFFRDQRPPRRYGVLGHLGDDLTSWPEVAYWLGGLGLAGYGVFALGRGDGALSLIPLVAGLLTLGQITRLARNAIRLYRHGRLREVQVTSANLIDDAGIPDAEKFFKLRFPLDEPSPGATVVILCRRWVRTMIERHGGVTLLVLVMSSEVTPIYLIGAKPVAPPSTDPVPTEGTVLAS